VAVAPQGTRDTMRTLAICRIREGVDPAIAVAPYAAEEIAALRALKARGVLREALSPGGPGAYLLFTGNKATTSEALNELPLYRARLLDIELVELKPFPGFE
jgi:hypothetical protein